MPDMKKRIPDFKSEEEERQFWATADSTEYVDWQSGKRKKLVRPEAVLANDLTAPSGLYD